MIHRPFLLKSFQSPLYLFTRRTCVSAATTILREHELADQDNECVPLWVHSAFAVTAVVVLCLNMIYADGNTAHGSHSLDTQLNLIQKARERLTGQKADSLARRGVYLIDALLNHFDIMSGNSQACSLDFDNVLSSFLDLEEQDQVKDPSAERSEHDMYSGPPLETPDFDQWFTGIFS